MAHLPVPFSEGLSHETQILPQGRAKFASHSCAGMPAPLLSAAFACLLPPQQQKDGLGAFQPFPISLIGALTGVCPATGHRNKQTVKGVSFLGADDRYVMSGSDDGHIYIWTTADGILRQWLQGDSYVVNCLEPHPCQPMSFATSGESLALSCQALSLNHLRGPPLLGAHKQLQALCLLYTPPDGGLRGQTQLRLGAPSCL